MPPKGVAADRGLLVNWARVSIEIHRGKGRNRPPRAPGPKGYPKAVKKGKRRPRPSSISRAMRPKSSQKDRRHFFPKPGAKNDGSLLYGLHAVQAALANPARKVRSLFLTERAAEAIGQKLLARAQVQMTDGDGISRLLPAGAVHQGAALQCEPLPRQELRDAVGESGNRRRIVLVLDQISDPHNAGAILRTAAAFGVAAVVVQDRHAPPQSGALAKAASGALDIVPYVEVVNISRALEQLGEMGFWRIALAGDGESDLAGAVPDGDVALVLGSEGAGIRRLVREHCDAAAYIPIDKAMESLNVSNAAAIALYEFRRS
jgi:23S rRNA (guanosine2251-2'-O)-methyltransferase